MHLGTYLYKTERRTPETAMRDKLESDPEWKGHCHVSGVARLSGDLELRLAGWLHSPRYSRRQPMLFVVR